MIGSQTSRIFAVLAMVVACVSFSQVAFSMTAEEKAAMDLYNKGRTLFDDGKFSTAEDLFAKSMTVYDNTYARIYRAACLARMGQCENVEMLLDKVNLLDVAPQGREKAQRMVLGARVQCNSEPSQETHEPDEEPADDDGKNHSASVGAPVPLPIPLPPSVKGGESRGAVNNRPVVQKNTVVIALDGSGDFTSLEQAVMSAREGQRLFIKTGLHRLPNPLVIDKSVTIAGESRDLSRIVCDKPGFVITIRGGAHVTMSDVSIDHEGGLWADVIVVTGNSTFDLRGISIRGAIRENIALRGGAGLWVQDKATGSVSSSRLVSNGLHGAKLSNNASVDFDTNIASDNAQGGIVFFDSSKGAVRMNVCDNNGKYGIGIVGSAKPALLDNICRGNRLGGAFVEHIENFDKEVFGPCPVFKIGRRR